VVDLLLIMIVLAAVAVFVTAPFRRVPADGPVPSEPLEEDAAEVRELEAARDAKLRELRDAELDHRTGKLSEPDYAAVDATLRAEAIEILRALDEARERVSAQEHEDRQSADTIND
jgi:hypothetical protein